MGSVEKDRKRGLKALGVITSMTRRTISTFSCDIARQYPPGLKRPAGQSSERSAGHLARRPAGLRDHRAVMALPATDAIAARLLR
jgi:hypothetical protein